MKNHLKNLKDFKLQNNRPIIQDPLFLGKKGKYNLH